MEEPKELFSSMPKPENVKDIQMTYGTCFCGKPAIGIYSNGNENMRRCEDHMDRM